MGQARSGSSLGDSADDCSRPGSVGLVAQTISSVKGLLCSLGPKREVRLAYCRPSDTGSTTRNELLVPATLCNRIWKMPVLRAPKSTARPARTVKDFR